MLRPDAELRSPRVGAAGGSEWRGGRTPDDAMPSAGSNEHVAVPTHFLGAHRREERLVRACRVRHSRGLVVDQLRNAREKTAASEKCSAEAISDNGSSVFSSSCFASSNRV